jgi:hypothetical protein
MCEVPSAILSPLYLAFPLERTDGTWQIGSPWVEETDAQRDRHVPPVQPEQLMGPPKRARIRKAGPRES